MLDSTIADPLGPDDPREIGSFTVIGVLGTGGMGEVYLGVSDRGHAAVKRVRARLVTSERFEREVGILYRVPVGVGPRVLASDGTAERPWFATEYVPGLTVDEAVRLRGPLPAEALWLLLAEAAAQLHAVHESGIVHRDVKPGNVMLVRDGVKLIDFGIARAADQARLTKSGGSYGTQGFSAPEQQSGDDTVGAPADVYGLGALLLYAASGRTPGVLPDVEPLRAVDADLAALVASCLVANPQARSTAHELAEAAREHLSDPSPSWPSEVTARIAVRRDFAATPVSKMDTVPPPDQDPEPDPEPTTVRLPRRRTRMILVPTAVLVALAAVAAFVVFAPTAPQNGNARSSGGATDALQPVGRTTQSSSASPSRSASSPARSASASPGLPTVPAGPNNGTGVTGGTGGVTGGVTTPPGVPGSTSNPGPGPGPTSAPPVPGPSPTASSISGINGGDDTTQVRGSEADTDWYANDAACSAWLDSDGSGDLAGVVNTSMGDSCQAVLYRSPGGTAFSFAASFGAAKTNFLPDAGHAMWICVWKIGAQSDEKCSPRFGMNGNTPVMQ
ncbi:serine/threonine-protein kinase [Streptacidiphilus melanogenes]|uniref:serine/threonine-protein kinase n=1 Tax=Streptacidiphilus melanogenes TaxID=411235 RepID=UPI0005AB235F|nr:serine/threonine-protein kinase [Streptacidiphilus melanogenes]